jgi:hypothetical protein
MKIVKLLKVDNVVYQNVEYETIKEDGTIEYLISNDVEVLKPYFIDTVKWRAHSVLSKTDWLVVKCMEEGLDMQTTYPDIFTHRKNVRDWSNALESTIANATTVDELLALDINPPTS